MTSTSFPIQKSDRTFNTMHYLFWWAILNVILSYCFGFPVLRRINVRWASREQARNQFQGDTLLQVPQRGLVTLEEDLTQSNSLSESEIVKFSPSSVRWNQMLTKFRLWFQYPWRKIDGKVVLKIKLNGDLSIEPSEKSFFSLKSQQENQEISSLYDLSTLFMFGAYDPRVRGVFVEMGTLQCGYAKLQEVRRMINLFRQSGKKVIGYSEVAKEKELFLAMGFDEFYIPPDGDLQLNGFSASANFVRGALDNIGIEPQVQRIGKYKSFGDTFNRNGISDEQRNVISSLLLQVSDLWAKDVAKQTNNTIVDIKSIWAAKGTRKPVDFVRSGLLSGIKYFDQVEEIVNTRFQSKKNKWSAWTWIAKMLARLNKIVLVDNTEAQYKEKTQEFDLQHDFEKYPRRRSSTSTTPALLTSEPPATAAVNQSANHTDATTEPVELSKQATAVNETARIIEFPFTAAPKATLLPGGSYLRKMTAGWGLLKGLPIKEVQSGQRIAIINAAGAIGSGESRGGLMGPVLGAETLIGQIRRARDDSDIKAVVLRVDSPGGSALASDLIWRELRLLSRVKPVVASQVDVAASGGYYLSMACDEIVAEQLSVTGSIGVVAAKFNVQKLQEKIGVNTETISIGRYAEVFSPSRGFTDEEAKYFEESAQNFYKSFVAKAAASRSMSYDDMQEVAQGRVWTGQQGLRNGLVDHQGGLWKALEVADQLYQEQEARRKQQKQLKKQKQVSPVSSTNPLISNSTIPLSNTSNTTTATAATKLPKRFRVQTFREQGRSVFSGLPFARAMVRCLGGASLAGGAGRGVAAASSVAEPLAMCDEVVLSTGFSSPESWGLGGGSKGGLLAASPVLPLLWHLLRNFL